MAVRLDERRGHRNHQHRADEHLAHRARPYFRPTTSTATELIVKKALFPQPWFNCTTSVSLIAVPGSNSVKLNGMVAGCAEYVTRGVSGTVPTRAPAGPAQTRIRRLER